MNTLRTILLPILAITFAPSFAEAQSQTVYPQVPIYQQPVLVAPAVPSVVAGVRSPLAACNCNPTNPGDCKCKDLDCKIRLPHNCKTSKPTKKTPVPCTIYGKIPVCTECLDCLSKVCDFNAETDVPQIHCTEEKCVEIGKKLVECLPGCCFSVCVPTYKCYTQSVECKLGKKVMPMQLWCRTEDNKKLYDVYVINNPDPKSAVHAGGMPAKWLIMHCGTENNVNTRFPGILQTGGLSLGDQKSQATSADVKVTLVVDQEAVEKYVDELDSTKERSQKEASVETEQSQSIGIDS